MQRLEKVFVAKGESTLMSFAGNDYAFQENQKQELVATVYVDGEKKLLRQYYAKPLLELVEQNGLLETGRQVYISRDEEGSYSVTFLQDGECKTLESDE